MNKYKVTGADKESGNERCELVFAKNPQRAEHSARLRGMYVSSIERLPDNFEVTTSTWRCTASKLEPLPPLPMSTSNDLPGEVLKDTVGVVFGEAIMGANVFRDIAAGVRDIVGGRAGAYESKLRQGRTLAIQEMLTEARLIKANAVISVKIDYETIGGSMLMICATGTAVTVEQQTESDTI